MIRKILVLLLFLLCLLPLSAKMEIVDEQSLQLALDTQDKVVLPDSQIIVTQRLRITRSGQKIKGGKGSVLKSLKPLNIFQVSPGVSNLSVKGVTFQGVGSKVEASYLIYVEHGARGIRISDCNFDGGTGGILVDYEGENVLVRKCSFSNMVYIPGAGLAASTGPSAGGAGGYGVVFQQRPEHDGVKHGRITRCTVHPTVIRHAFYIQSSEDIEIDHNKVYGTEAMNDQTLMDNLLTTGLSNEEIALVDVKRHMTIYDAAMVFRGGKNIHIHDNECVGGIGAIRGTTDRSGKRGCLFRIKNNTIRNMILPKEGMKEVNPDFIEDYK